MYVDDIGHLVPHMRPEMALEADEQQAVGLATMLGELRVRLNADKAVRQLWPMGPGAYRSSRSFYKQGVQKDPAERSKVARYLGPYLSYNVSFTPELESRIAISKCTFHAFSQIWYRRVDFKFKI